MTRAETAMQDAKRQGRDSFSLYLLSDEQRRDQRRDMAVGEEVKEALKDNRLTFDYQPIVDSHGSSVAFYECLLRMLTTAGEIVTAGDFVPVVERLGLARIMGRLVQDAGGGE